MLELELGNIHLLMAAAIALTVRWPAAWSFLILTKVTPGIGVLWYAFRGEWRNLAIATGTTGLIVLVGIALWPELWGQWFQSLIGMSQLPSRSLFGPLALRLPVALSILVFAARTDRRWLLPFVIILAMPSIWWHSLAILAAVPYLLVPAGVRQHTEKPTQWWVPRRVAPQTF